MARLNFEEEWWTSPYRGALSRLLKDEELADGCASKAMRVAQTYWSKGGLIPFDAFIRLRGSFEMIEAGFVRLYKNNDHKSEQIRTPFEEIRTFVRDSIEHVEHSYVYVRGSEAHHSWTREKHENAVEAGKRSAEVRREKHGTAQPSGGKGSNRTEQDPNTVRTKSNGTEPSYSSSISNSVSKKNITKKVNSVVESKSAAPNATHPVIPLLAQESLDGVLKFVPQQVQEQWILTFRDIPWIKHFLEDAILFYSARGDFETRGWPEILSKALQRARREGLTTNGGHPKGRSELGDAFYNSLEGGDESLAQHGENDSHDLNDEIPWGDE